MYSIDDLANKFKIQVNNLNNSNHTLSKLSHSISKENIEQIYRENINELKDILLKENKTFDNIEEVDFENYLNWLVNGR